MKIAAVDDRIDLTSIAIPIRASSNFRFEWRFFEVSDCNVQSPGDVLQAFNAIVKGEELHSFLRDTLDDIYPRPFTIERLHKHCSIDPAKSEFLDTFARAAHDRLGAYSRVTYASTSDERKVIERLFASIGYFLAFTVTPGSQAGCEVCSYYNNHLFSSWFFDVAWDFTYFVTWPDLNLLWMGCMSDTD